MGRWYLIAFHLVHGLRYIVITIWTLTVTVAYWPHPDSHHNKIEPCSSIQTKTYFILTLLLIQATERLPSKPIQHNIAVTLMGGQRHLIYLISNILIEQSPPAIAILFSSGEKSSVNTPLARPVTVPTHSLLLWWSKILASFMLLPPAAIYLPRPS